MFYEGGEDYVSKRAQFRELHLKKAWEAAKCGELILAGALAKPVDGAVLLFRGDSPEVAAQFAKTDPYVVNGAVKRWYIREWTTVAGQDAATPIRPRTTEEQGGDSFIRSAFDYKTADLFHCDREEITYGVTH